MFYNVEPSMDLEIFKKRVKEAIQKESLKKNMSDVISAKMADKYLTPELLTQTDTDERDFYLKSLLLYSHEDDSLNEKHFRTVTLTGNDLEITSYPLLINLLVCNGEIDVRGYTYEKFNRLNKFLTGFDKIENSMDE